MTLKKIISNLFSNKKNKEIKELKSIIENHTRIKQEQIDKVNKYWLAKEYKWKSSKSESKYNKS